MTVCRYFLQEPGPPSGAYDGVSAWAEFKDREFYVPMCPSNGAYRSRVPCFEVTDSALEKAAAYLLYGSARKRALRLWEPYRRFDGRDIWRHSELYLTPAAVIRPGEMPYLRDDEMIVVGPPENVGKILQIDNRRGVFVYEDASALLYKVDPRLLTPDERHIL